MAATPIPFATKDNASGRLQSGVNASVLSIPLQSGDGANFPQPYTGAATSLGSAVALNSTGISAAVGGSAVIGKLIWNKTDGSVAVITAVATDALTTTRLLGGSDNTWQSSDVWCIDPFVLTLEKVSTSAYGVQSTTQREEVLVTARSTDTLSVPTGGRGYNGTVANTFDASDYAYLHVTSPIVERFKDVLSVVAAQVNTNVTDIATRAAEIDAIESNATFYVAAAGSSNAFTGTLSAMPAAYTTGERLYFKANHTISGSATFNRAGLGAKTIKKLDGATNLAASDIISGQIVEIVYDGTNYLMQSPIGQVSGQDADVVAADIATSASVGASSTSKVYLATKYVAPAAAWAAGKALRLVCGGNQTWGAGTMTVRVEVNRVVVWDSTPVTPSASGEAWRVDCDLTCRAAGAGGSLMPNGVLQMGIHANHRTSLGVAPAATAVDLSADRDVEVSVQFGTSNGTNGLDMRSFVGVFLNAN